jgi:hypothetical protein
VGNRDQDYYRKRLEQESAAAQNSRCAYARDVHLDLATRYSEKLRLMEALSSETSLSEPRLKVAPVRRTAFG